MWFQSNKKARQIIKYLESNEGYRLHFYNTHTFWHNVIYCKCGAFFVKDNKLQESSHPIRRVDITDVIVAHLKKIIKEGWVERSNKKSITVKQLFKYKCYYLKKK